MHIMAKNELPRGSMFVDLMNNILWRLYKMKKALSLTLAIAMMLTMLAACGSDSSDSTTSSQPTITDATLHDQVAVLGRGHFCHT